MPKFLQTAPVLLVADVQLADYYRDKLGFAYDRLWGEPPCFCMVHRDCLTLMLSQVPAGEPPDTSFRQEEGVWNAYFWVDDAQAVHQEFLDRGADVVCEPSVKIYQVLEFDVRDLDGHVIGVGQAID